MPAGGKLAMQNQEPQVAKARRWTQQKCRRREQFGRSRLQTQSPGNRGSPSGNSGGKSALGGKVQFGLPPHLGGPETRFLVAQNVPRTLGEMPTLRA